MLLHYLTKKLIQTGDRYTFCGLLNVGFGGLVVVSSMNLLAIVNDDKLLTPRYCCPHTVFSHIPIRITWFGIENTFVLNVHLNETLTPIIFALGFRAKAT